MINAILTGIMNLIISLVDIVLAPIDLLIEQFLPDLSSGISAIGAFFALAKQYLGFAVSITGLSSTALSLIVLYYVFKLSVPLLISAIKNAIKWYDKLKP